MKIINISSILQFGQFDLSGILVDNHEIVRKGIRALLATKRDIQVVGEAGDGAEAVA